MAAGIRSVAAGLIVLLALASPGLSQTPPQIPAPLGDPPPPMTDAALDTAFQCPESLGSDAERRQAMVVYFHWVQAAHPDWSVADAVEFKKTLLVRHSCEASLRDLADYTKREQLKPRRK